MGGFDKFELNSFWQLEESWCSLGLLCHVTTMEQVDAASPESLDEGLSLDFNLAKSENKYEWGAIIKIPSA